MLRRHLAVVAFMGIVIAGTGLALAADATTTAPTITLTTEDTTNWTSVPAALDQCVAGIQLRNDPSVCKGLSTYLGAFSARVGIAARAAAAPPTPPASPAPIPGPAKP